MSEMVERVAKALFRHDVERARPFSAVDYVRLIYGDPPCAWGELAESAQGPFRAQARVAIAAMREPTAAMVRAGRDSGVVNVESEADVDQAWRCMVDAALADG